MLERERRLVETFEAVLGVLENYTIGTRPLVALDEGLGDLARRSREVLRVYRPAAEAAYAAESADEETRTTLSGDELLVAAAVVSVGARLLAEDLGARTPLDGRSTPTRPELLEALRIAARRLAEADPRARDVYHAPGAGGAGRGSEE